MSHVFHRLPTEPMPTAVSGDGCYIVDSNGKRYLDASGGAAVSCLGHSHPAVRQAMHAQIDKIAFAYSGFFTSEPMEELADYLISNAPEGLERVFFVSGGSEALESAIKISRQYFVEIGQKQRTKLIARRQSYHGNTLGALSLGGNMARRELYQPVLLENAHHIAPCYAYRDKRHDESEEAYGRRVADELEAKILELGPDTVAAFACEPVVGATSGVVPAVSGYLKRIREICDKYGVLLIFDEVMCGMGRTGYLFACEEDGVAPDLLCIAKGLGAGYQPIGAMLVAGKICKAIDEGSGAFMHGHTYMGHTLSSATALAVQKVIRDDNLLENVRKRGVELRTALEERFGNHHHVGDIRGRGLFVGIELVADRTTKQTFDPKLALHNKIRLKAMEEGLMCYPGAGTIDGKNGTHILLAPPFIIDETHIAEIVEKLGRVLDSVLADAKTSA
ncbi:MAG: aspartate aminotransferase family protein [Alphaproteobacteria bacterium]|nr:aspartate aminotransferase family protein [Alphaproteobacteria bacterium]MBU0796879.1 aspartate aminotransferase family protein [Alphaproteobacteria bacterium]MBU0886925.1 aspartate aminotransferase family protein [Alphaproteobacteria bacterium]MBU1813219.1 aspartate aminotransferase family protein [Alphaproteobacteria bacterium]MBU2092127.1 aspartate aminotransferase family protein [Alphaproteobacteria bacterium]